MKASSLMFLSVCVWSWFPLILNWKFEMFIQNLGPELYFFCPCGHTSYHVTEETVSLLKVACFILCHVDMLLGNDREISNTTTTVTRQLPVNCNGGAVFSAWSIQRCYKQGQLVFAVSPLGGGLEYLRLSPASRRRWRNYCAGDGRQQNRPVVRQGAPHQQTHNVWQ
jgi:hypothetical protein